MPPHPMTQMGLQLFWLRNSGPADSSLASLRRAGCWARRHPRPQLCSLQRPLRALLPWEQHVGGEVSALLSPLAKNPPSQEASPGTPAGLPCGHVATPGGGRGRDLSRAEARAPACNAQLPLVLCPPSRALRPHRPGTTCPEAVTTCAPQPRRLGKGADKASPGLKALDNKTKRTLRTKEGV